METETKKFIDCEMIDASYKKVLFKNCLFEQSRFNDCKFTNCIFDNCIFSGVTFTRCVFENVVFSRCILGKNPVQNEKPAGCFFRGCLFVETNFKRSNVFLQEMNNCLLEKCIFSATQNSNFSIINSNINECSIRNFSIKGGNSIFKSCNFTKCRLYFNSPNMRFRKNTYNGCSIERKPWSTHKIDHRNFYKSKFNKCYIDFNNGVSGKIIDAIFSGHNIYAGILEKITFRFCRFERYCDIERTSLIINTKYCTFEKNYS